MFEIISSLHKRNLQQVLDKHNFHPQELYDSIKCFMIYSQFPPFCHQLQPPLLMVNLDIICFVEFAWKREVSANINPAKIGMMLRLPMLPESNQMLRKHSKIVLYPFCMPQYWFPLVKYQVLCRNWRFEDPKDLIEDLEHILHVPWSIFGSLSPLSPGKEQFISQIVKIAHKI